MKLKYVNLGSSKRKSKGNSELAQVKRVDELKRELMGLERDILDYIFDEYNLSADLTTEEKIDELSKNHASALDKQIPHLKHSYNNDQIIFKKHKLESISYELLDIIYTNLFGNGFFHSKSHKIKRIINNFDLDTINVNIIKAQNDLNDIKIRRENIRNDLDSLEDEELEILFGEYGISRFYNRKYKISNLLKHDLDKVEESIGKVKSMEIEKKVDLDLKMHLESLSDDELSTLFNRFYLFGDYLSREDKINNLLELEKDVLLAEID